MAKTDVSAYIARRLTAYKEGGANGVMVKIATLSVVIGLAVMLVALGVIYGFKREITRKLTGVMSHVQILHFQSTVWDGLPVSAHQPFLDDIPRLPGFESMNAYAVKSGIVRGDDVMQGVIVKGIGTDFDWKFFRDALTDGDLPDVNNTERNRDAMISRRLADHLRLETGDRLELLFVQQPPRRDLYKICGIYDTGLQDMDEMLILTDIRNVQRVNNWTEDQVSGFEINTRSARDIERFAGEVYDLLFGMQTRIEDPLMVTDLKENNPMIFDWLDTHDLNAAIIIVVMLLVAIFNMTAALLIILLEKTSMIGILKSLGMSNRAVQKIFVYRSAAIVLRGLFWGNLIGLGLCGLQQATGWVKLDAEGYFLATVPIYIDWTAVVLLNAGVFAAIVLMLTLPVSVVSRVMPEKTIRFES